MEKDIKRLINNEIKELNIVSNSCDITRCIGKYFAKYLPNKSIIALNGELGSGKTAFVCGFASYFNIESEVSSPTFTIVNEYSNNIYHFDVYKLKGEDEFLTTIGDEYFENGICIIEWANIIKNILPKKTIFIDISKDSKDSNIRNLHIWRK